MSNVEHYLIPTIQKKPSDIILHSRTNDAKNLLLKQSSHDSFSTCGVFISTPTLRIDDGKAQITVSQLTKHLWQLKIATINNNNINVRHLEGKGLHLNQSSSTLLSKNFLNVTKNF